MAIKECRQGERGLEDRLFYEILTKYLINGDSSVGFMGGDNKYLDFSTEPIKYRSRRVIRIPDFCRFIEYFENHPNEYSFNCVDVLGLVSILVFREHLKLRFGKKITDRFLNECEIEIKADDTNLRIGGVKYYPLWIFGKDKPADGEAASIVPGYQLYMHISGTVRIDGHIRPGAFLIMGNAGARHLPCYSINDDQNGILMSEINGAVDGKETLLFAHRSSVDKRVSTLAEEAAKLIGRIKGYGMSLDEFNNRGGMLLRFSQVDYPKLVAAGSQVITGR